MEVTIENDIPLFKEDQFPPVDLMNTLVDLYFRKTNDHLPLLHEPTFKKGLQTGRYLREGGFGATVLLVCANGSRFTSDPRVLLDDSDHPQSAGWKWVRMVEGTRKLPLAPAKLHDLQIYVVRCLVILK